MMKRIGMEFVLWCVMFNDGHRQRAVCAECAGELCVCMWCNLCGTMFVCGTHPKTPQPQEPSTIVEWLCASAMLNTLSALSYKHQLTRFVECHHIIKTYLESLFQCCVVNCGAGLPVVWG